MKKIISVLLSIVIIALSLPLGAFAITASALTSDSYTYEIDDNKATITAVDKQTSGKITVPDTLGGYEVVAIGDRAFYECKNITEIVVPDSVTSIGDGAFALCENLKDVTLPEGIDAINKGVFSDCVKLENVTIPESVESIGEIAFANCKALKSINISQNVVSIGGLAFDGCELLASIEIPDSVLTVGEGVFFNCLGLVDVTIGGGINAISKQMFYGCTSITEIVIPDSVETIGNSAFDGCTSLAMLQLTRNVELIKSYAFSDCDNLADVWYTGNEADKNNIAIELYNDALLEADWHYDLCEPSDHNYNGDCLTGCSICGWVPAEHTYDDIYDETCNICGSEREVPAREWQIEVDATGVYVVVLAYDPTADANELEGYQGPLVEVLDKNGNTVKYNDAKAGYPLVAGLKYTVKPTVDFKFIGCSYIKVSNTIFTDTSASGWYNDAVIYSVGAGLINGYGGTTRFGTADNIQRQDFVVILARLAGVDLDNYVSSGNYSFADVPSGAYYEKAIMWAADCGITTGYAGGTKFGVGDKITREQLVTFLYRYAKYANGGIAPTVSADAEQSAKTYADYNGVNDYAKEAVIWALDKGVIKGQGGTHIAPSGNALRCEIAQIMYNIYLNDTF